MVGGGQCCNAFPQTPPMNTRLYWSLLGVVIGFPDKSHVDWKKVNMYLIQNNIIIWLQQQWKETPAPVDEVFRWWPASGVADRGLGQWMKTASRNRSSVPQNPPARLLHIPSPPSVLQTHSNEQSNAMLPKYEHYHTVLNK